MAEIMFLTKSFGDLRSKLGSNAQMYEDCIETYKREAAEKDTRICALEEELRETNMRIHLLESQIEEPASELEDKRAINANLALTVTDLQGELDSASINAARYKDVIAILRREVELVQVRLSAADDEAGLNERELEELLSKAKELLACEKERATEALEDKDTRIALLDRELAETFDEIYSIQEAAKETNGRVYTMTGMCDMERYRADALDKKISKLNHFTTNVAGAKARADDDVNYLTSVESDCLAKLPN